VKISVAMATYNGASYLGQQLQSIAAQSLLPGEVVLGDDASTDDTRDIARRFAAAVPFAVQVLGHPRTLGVVGNFQQAIAACTGEIIVLADQDDVWRPQKLARIAEAFAGDPALALVFSDADAIDAQGRPLGYRLWPAVGFTPPEQRAVGGGRLLASLLRRNVVTGATLAFRATFRDLLLPIPSFVQHDAWIATLLAAVADCRALVEPLIAYRQHPQQQQGERPLGWWAQLRAARAEDAAKFDLVARRHAAAAQRLRQFAHRWDTAEAAAALQRKAEHFLAKARMRGAAWRGPLIARELLRGHYHRYSRGWKSLAQDLLL